MLGYQAVAGPKTNLKSLLFVQLIVGELDHEVFYERDVVVNASRVCDNFFKPQELVGLMDMLPKHNTDHSPLHRHTSVYTVEVADE